MKTLRICLIFCKTAAKTKMEVFRKILKGRNHVAGRLVRPEGSPSVVAALWLILFCFLISIPSSLSIPVKSRESSGIVLLTGVYNKELQCLREAAWFEAANQPEEGIRAVLQVIKNRKEAKGFPSSFCGVVHQPRQFSYRNDLQPGHTKHIKIKNSLDKEVLERIHHLSELTAQGTLRNDLPEGTLYYVKVGVKTKWMRDLRYITTIGAHKFYGS